MRSTSITQSRKPSRPLGDIPDARYVERPSLRGHVTASLAKPADVDFMNRVIGDFETSLSTTGGETQVSYMRFPLPLAVFDPPPPEPPFGSEPVKKSAAQPKKCGARR